MRKEHLNLKIFLKYEKSQLPQSWHSIYEHGNTLIR